MTAIRRRETDRHSNEQAMAATGGGKIRSRRYHIASKPYAKSKQQPGLINRVTNTVKSIVPSWLQKYFKGEEPAEEGGALQGLEEDSQTLPPNGNEEGPPPHDGWDSPEPSTSHTEPSTSRASLNLQDNVLSRPPLNRSHPLHFPLPEASSPLLGPPSSLFPPPSTSLAPGPFTTGFSLVKEIKDNLSQHEDDNISTTSGFSSRASEKDVPASKMVSGPRLWSPESDRTHSGLPASQSSLKKPAFNLSLFGTSSNSTLNSTVLNSSQLGDSPFYPGKTTYGGAAAARSLRTRPSTPYQAPVRRQIKARPAGAAPCGVTSGTARRILQSLERMSSPLADAKRIPSAASSPMSASMDGTNLDYSHFQAKKKRLEPSLPPVQKMFVPTAAAVSGNRSVSFRPSLTPGGSGRFLDRTSRDTPTIQSSHLPDASPGPSQSTTNCSRPDYPLSSTPAASVTAAGGGGKMKRERTTTRPSSKRPDDDEVAEVPDLPAISLPISAFSLPTFSFSTLPLTTTAKPRASVATPSPAKETVAEKEPAASSTPPCLPFTFASPIVKATAASPPSFSPSAGFTFSAPVAKMGSSMSNGKLAHIPAEAADFPSPTMRRPTGGVNLYNKNTEDFDGPFKPAKTLKQGSVLDLLKSPGFASPVTSTSPSANSAPLSSSTVSPSPALSSSSAGFGNMFQPAPGSWSCDVCMVQNKQSDAKCVACGTQLPKSTSTTTTTTSSSSSSSFSSSSCFKPLNSTATENNKTAPKAAVGFGAMFARPAGMWDCDTCLVQNKAEAVKCVACDTAKPGTGVKASLTLPSAFAPVAPEASPAAPPPTALPSFGDMFKKPEGTWQCDTCMVDNKAQDTKCVACMTSKPGASAAPPASASAPASTSAPALGFGDMFKKPEGAWDCDVCCVQNKGADLTCVACQTAKPGAVVEPKGFSSSFGSSGAAFGTSGSGGFKFGTSAASDSLPADNAGFKFGAALSDSASSSSTGGFKFGTSTSETPSKDTSASLGFKFGSATEGFKFGTAAVTDSTATDSKQPESSSGGPGFKFGDSSGTLFGAGASSAEATTPNVGFSFGLSKPDETTTTAATAAASAPSVTFTLPTTATENTSSTDGASLKTSVFGRLGGPLTSAASSSPTPSFGAAVSTEKEAAAPAAFSFGKPEEKEPAGFMFGAASKGSDATMMSPPAEMGGFSFNTPLAAAKEQAPPPPYPFGKPADKGEVAAAEVPKTGFSFGQSAADPSAAPKPFSFNPTPVSSSAPAPSLFGSGPAQAPAAAASPAPSSFMFGKGSLAPAAAPGPATAQPFLFGASASAAPPAANPPGFSFGEVVPAHGLSAAPSSTSSPFVFSSAPTSGFGAGQAPPSTGAFGAAQAAPAFGSTFGSPAPSPFSGPAAKTPAFGAKPNAAPVFGQQANSTPVFGAVPNPTQPGFQFGGATPFGAPANNTGVFAFGGGAPPALSAAPSAAPQQTAQAGFTFAQPPAFNIGSAKTFTATPAGQAPIAGRKIKTAVRRRK
ncbi:nuclear pore complex protein Nup153 [Gadus chalcogrammus]|uniref:nuclear pore complex protein Nup153 n=1 Tax=Gadus chalcogrammus TaxID=1042646 RepID=UPI0024C49B48|nr:nuclear pore complex protein Nup153 [Gadus chalcogrammus]